MINRPIVDGARNVLTGDARVTMNAAAVAAIEELNLRGAAFPDITNIIFNTCTSKSRAVRDASGNLVIDPKTEKPVRETVAVNPTLATTIYFVDGSKVTVTNSEKDKVVDADGNVTKEARERGIIYAIVKRLLSRFEKNEKTGEVELKSEGFGRILDTWVKDAYDQQKAEAERAKAKAAAKAEHERRAAEAKTSPRKRVSLAKTVENLSAVVESLAAKLNVTLPEA